MAQTEQRPDKPTRNAWRHRHAKVYAAHWRQPAPGIATGVITGGGGGGVTAALTHLNPGIYVVIGVASGLIGALLPWGGAYLFAAITAGGRVMRERMASIEQLLREQPRAAAQESAPSDIQHPGLLPAFPTLAIVENQAGRRKTLPDPHDGNITLSVRLWATNESPSEAVRILTSRVDNVVRDNSTVLRTTNVPGTVSEMHNPPRAQLTGPRIPVPEVSIAPRATIDLLCQFTVVAHQDGQGAWVDPGVVEGTVFLIDQFGQDHEAGRLAWH